MAPTSENASMRPEKKTEAIEELKNLKTEEMKPVEDRANIKVAEDEKTEEKGSSCEDGQGSIKNEKDDEKEEVVPVEVEPETEEPQIKKEKDNEKVDKKEEVVPLEVEPKTGVSFPVKLTDGKKLNCVGLRKKSMLGMGIKIYGFGIYTDGEKLKNLLKSKIGKVQMKPRKEMYQMVIDDDFGMTVRLVIVFSKLTMNMVKKNFDEGLGASIQKLTGGKKDDTLAKKVMGEASDNIKLSPGSIIEISRSPGYVLQTKVMGEMVSKVESELLCRAYVNMYLGDDAFDKEAKEKFGASLLSVM